MTASDIPATAPSQPTRKVRILIADDEVVTANALGDFLEKRGFEIKTAANGGEVHETLETWRPDFVIYDLTLPELNAIEFMKHLKAASLLADDKIRVFVSSGHNTISNIRECMRKGATDYLVKPLVHADVLSRLVLQIQTKRSLKEIRPGAMDDEGAHYYMHLTDLLMREALKGNATTDTIHNLMGMLGVSTGAVRVSLIRCDFETRRGAVMASSDKRSIGGLAIDLGKYPEILYVLKQDKLLAIDNIANDPTLHFVTRQDKEIKFSSMIVCPVRIGNSLWGVLSVRLPDSKKNLNDFEIRYAQLVGHIAAMVVSKDQRMLSPWSAIEESEVPAA